MESLTKFSLSSTQIPIVHSRKIGFQFCSLKHFSWECTRVSQSMIKLSLQLYSLCCCIPLVKQQLIMSAKLSRRSKCVARISYGFSPTAGRLGTSTRLLLPLALLTRYYGCSFLLNSEVESCEISVGCAYIVHVIHPKDLTYTCLLYTSPSPRDLSTSRMPSSA